jgi:Fe2+ or Zn2+ uptake regulation protein
MEKTFIGTLKKSNKYITDDRLSLFRHLCDQESPLSIQLIVKNLCNSMDEATVYRNIKMFERLGVVTRVYTGWKYKIELSDNFSAHHHHMLCTNCNLIVSFEESSQFIGELKKIEVQNGFRVQSHTLELQGLCSSCC